MADLPAVLFVDDDATILAALAATFRHAPVTALFARSGPRPSGPSRRPTRTWW